MSTTGAVFAGPLGSLLAGATDLAHHCIRCGFCLPACPTYRETLLETESPRGRIQLVRALGEGRLAPSDVAPHLDRCIGCRACETACPAGVRYGAIAEQARAAIEPLTPRGAAERWLRRLGIGWMLGRPSGIRLAAWGVYLYQASGLAWVVRRVGLLRRLAPSFAELEAVLPRRAAPWRTARRPNAARVRGALPARGRVAFFVGCVQEAALPEVRQAAIRVLEAAGFEVVIPPGQGCCGAVHIHAGQHARALRQARRNLEAFERVDADYVVSIAGGCGAALKEYPEWLQRDGSPMGERVRRFSARVRDFHELLDGVPLPPMASLDEVVTYQDSCHLRNVQKVTDAPRRLLRRIPGLRFVELPEADRCCGAGGIYNLTQPEMSARVLQGKMQQVRATGAMVLAVSNTPCHLQLLAGARRHGLDAQGLRVRHVAELLDEAITRATQASAPRRPPPTAPGG